MSDNDDILDRVIYPKPKKRREPKLYYYKKMSAPMTPEEIEQAMNPPQLPPDGTKICMGVCGEELPATTDYFDRDLSRDDGLRNVCKACRAKERQLAAYKEINEKVRQMDERSMEMLDTIANSGARLPHIAEIYENTMEAFGGSAGLAAHLMGQYLSAKPGSTQRTKTLELIIRLATKVTEMGAAQLPVDLMNDEDLAIAFDRGLQKFAPRIAHDDGAAEKAS